MADKPLSVDQTLLKARRHAQKGEVQLAERLCRSVLARFPNNNRAIAALNALKLPDAAGRGGAPSREQIQGVIALYTQGRLREALTQGSALAAQYPTAGIVHNVLGVVSAGLGRLDLAVACYTRALQVTPDSPEALNNLGNALGGLGKFQDAVASYKKALRIKPDYAEAHNNLGNTLRDLGQIEGAIARFTEALRLQPNFAEAYNNLGNAFRDLGRQEDAIESYTAALRINPNYAEAHNNLGSACFDVAEHSRAIDSFTRALQIRPEYPEAHNNLGIVLRELGRHDAAVASYTETLRLRPDYVVAHNNLGNALRDVGKHEEARTSYSRALQLRPDFAEAHYSLGTLTEYRPDDPRIAEMQAQIASPSLSDSDRTLLSFALGKACEDLGDTESAFRHFEEGNRLRRQELSYDIGSDEALFSKVKSLFAAEHLPDLRARDVFPGRKRAPIFIVGMPRSGTTLAEQILASHSLVYGAGELKALSRAVKPILDGISGGRSGDLTSDVIRHVRESYLAELNELGDGASCVTDKMPLNFRWIGFILTAVPEARVINLRRDPVATCWSVFKHYFSARGNGYAYDLIDIANYYNLYVDLMEFWRTGFPGRVYDLDYQALTESQEAETRSLLEFCGLDWEDACLDFHRSARSVKTASAVQVRQGMYTGSSEAWRKYEAHLQPLLQALAGRTTKV